MDSMISKKRLGLQESVGQPSNGVSSSNNRLPLKETSGNIPSPTFKKTKLNKIDHTQASSIALNKPSLPQPNNNLHNHNFNHNHPHNNNNNNNRYQIRLQHNQNVNQTSNSVSQNHHHQEKSTSNTKSTRLVGEELRNWQISWRKIMKESIIYFDKQGFDSTNPTQYSEMKRASKALKTVGCTISEFFDIEVRIIISRRPFNPKIEYPSADVFAKAVHHKIKVWDYDKVFRFLKNLGANDSPISNSKGNLSNLLHEEKVFGSTDRDPNARRDDLHYLDKNYLYVYDLSQNVRPIAIREWSNDSYPMIQNTLDGKCPFIPDPSENSDRKKLRRLQKFSATKEYRDLLKKVTTDIMNHAKEGIQLDSSGFTGTSTSTDRIEDKDDYQKPKDSDVFNEETKVHDTISTSKYDFKAPPAPLIRNSSCVQPFQHSNYNSNLNSNSKYYEVAASGYNGASNAVQCSMDSTLNSNAAAQQQGNGLGPMVSAVPSKNINNLKRRIFVKKQKQKPDSSRSHHHNQDRDLNPGYCENCRIKYDHFDDHIVSNRHRNFACDDRNFRDIDSLVLRLNDSKRRGMVTSNGDYSYSN